MISREADTAYTSQYGVHDLDEQPKRYGWSTENERGYKIQETLYGTERKLRVIGIGAGATGICLAKFLPDQLKNVSLTIYEKNPEYGGTWYENRYPGVACDIPSHIYQFFWAKNPDWSQFYSEGSEILQYFKDCVERFDLGKYIHLEHEIIGANWDDDRGVWEVKVKNLLNGAEFIDVAEILINCTGILNSWNWPNIEGLHNFEGKLCHTADYDSTTELASKRVAVIGIGSSGVQVIPKIVDQVSQLYCWIRSPTWMTAGFAQKFAGPNGANFDYPEEKKQYFKDNPDKYLDYCKEIESEISQMFKSILRETPESLGAKKFSIEQMKDRLRDKPEIAKQIIPTDFSVGCRRPTPGNGFLEALTKPHVTTFLQTMKKITKKGFVDAEGKEHEVDVIICATGFDTSWVPRFPIVANGLNVQDIQATRPISYLSLAVPEIPNYFTIGGPYFSFGHGSYTSMVELFLTNILTMVKKVQKERIKSVAPSKKATNEFVEHADLWLKRTVWSEPCPSWFKQGKRDGLLTIFPGSRLILADMMSSPRYEDYEYVHWNENRFEHLGNGFATVEFDGSDIAWYLGTKDASKGMLPTGPPAKAIAENGVIAP